MDTIYIKLIESFLKDKFFDQLRTKEALGYIASLFAIEAEGYYGMANVLQSNSKTPEFCAERVRAFIKDSFKKVKEITDEEFKSHVNSKIVLEKKKDDNLNEAFLRNWGEINENTYKFDKKEKNVEILEKCTKEEFIKFYEKYLINEVCILDCEFVCEAHYEENEKLMKETKISEDEKIIKRVICDNIDDFKDCNSLFPIYNNPLFMSLNN